MNRHYVLPAMAATLIGMSGLLTSCGKTAKAPAETATEGTEIFFADPTIYTENGKYYLTGTRNADPLGFTMLESDDLQTWRLARPDSMILRTGENTFGTQGFWAPQILKKDGKYLLAYTANEQVVLAKGDSVNALFTQEIAEPIDGSEKNIDPFIFRDDDGKYYLYHVRFDNGNWLWVGEFDIETGKIKEGTLQPVFRNDQAWEATDAYPSAVIMEGPTVVKMDGTYYIFYSANHFMSDDYAVGYATADSPTGPWTKNPNNPIIHRNIVGEKGSGHGDVFTDKDGNLRYVYHVHHNDSVVSPRRTRIVTLNVDKSAGQPYAITADTTTIIKPMRVN